MTGGNSPPVPAAPATALAAQQQALLAALWRRQPSDAIENAAEWADPARAGGTKHLERGLAAYRSHAAALAPRALSAAYPVVAQLLGEEGFTAVARECWRRHPPACGDLALWGADLPALLATLPGLAADEPYLPDVARIEWALHRAATAADGAADPASLALLARAEPEALLLRLAPGTVCIDSAWPVASIVQAHVAGEPTLAAAGDLLRAGVAETALVWRQGLRPCLRLARPGEAAFIGALQAGLTLAAALEAAAGFDASTWLAPAVHQGLLLGVQAAASTLSPGDPFA